MALLRLMGGDLKRYRKELLRLLAQVRTYEGLYLLGGCHRVVLSKFISPQAYARLVGFRCADDQNRRITTFGSYV